MKELFIGDLHFDCRRQVGTTKESVYLMERSKFYSLEDLIKEIEPDVVYILGDLFDRPVVDEWFKVLFVQMLNELTCDVVILRGNHDSKNFRYDQLCSLELINELSKAVVVYNEPELINNCYCIPHCFNQEEFDRCLKEVPESTTVLLHTNVMSGFAEGEQSLNLDRDQIKELLDKGCDIITGHEHNHRRLFNGSLIVLGCFQPTSISDCDGDKYVVVRENGSDKFIKVWDKSTEYLKTEWDSLKIGTQEIIEITGDVSIDESIEANKAVASLRKQLNAYIVKNSVKVRNKDLDVTAEDVTNYNIVDIFKKALDDETRKIVEEITNEDIL